MQSFNIRRVSLQFLSLGCISLGVCFSILSWFSWMTSELRVCSASCSMCPLAIHQVLTETSKPSILKPCAKVVLTPPTASAAGTWLGPSQSDHYIPFGNYDWLCTGRWPLQNQWKAIWYSSELFRTCSFLFFWIWTWQDVSLEWLATILLSHSILRTKTTERRAEKELKGGWC